MTARSRALGSATLAIFGVLLLAACSTDGVTPDCSDAAVCAPTYGAPDGGADAPSDAPADGG